MCSPIVFIPKRVEMLACALIQSAECNYNKRSIAIDFVSIRQVSRKKAFHICIVLLPREIMKGVKGSYIQSNESRLHLTLFFLTIKAFCEKHK